MKKLLLQAFVNVKAYKEAQKKPKKEEQDLLFISFHDDGVYLNNLKIIDKRAVLQIAVLKLLIEKSLIGRLNSTSTGVNTYQLSTAIKKKGFQSFDSEKNIRQSIYQIKRNVSQKFGKQIGDNFIQSSTISGQYRLGKNVVLI